MADKNIKGKGKGKHKDNVIGRGREGGILYQVLCKINAYIYYAVQVEKDEFFDMLRSGGIVSKV